MVAVESALAVVGGAWASINAKAVASEAQSSATPNTQATIENDLPASNVMDEIKGPMVIVNEKY